jgi:hypothetical protein
MSLRRFEDAILTVASAPARSSHRLARTLALLEDGAPGAYVGIFAVTARRAGSDLRSLEALVRAGLAGTLAVLAAGLIARALPRERPPQRLWSSRRAASDEHAFPSDHAAGAAAFYCAAGELPPWPRRAVRILAVTTIASRLALARHWPSDLAAGVALGVTAERLVRGAPRATIHLAYWAQRLLLLAPQEAASPASCLLLPGPQQAPLPPTPRGSLLSAPRDRSRWAR